MYQKKPKISEYDLRAIENLQNYIWRDEQYKYINKHIFHECDTCAGEVPLLMVDTEKTFLGKNGFVRF